ncbi:sugar ABC transporter ATP-binding protein [Enterocloster sp. OA13]|uniref:Sugar ABC transporter ATP-binding protein n=1 Tax=Enterocloster hominis (ex Hitch et al. 2024) TaxID=1917870 RepID=A0ABV1D5M8_9FIRM|nr:sugar ABC transporter ATP-binding protein [Lachnoclostridium pacaense]EEQ61958.1 sugar ABC transporter, ATP binding protein [Clostridiales bacterium 1_7_47FAA]MCC2818279.1 sugar ABC transporter ATP-binding protein [Lachnoclostridium pacaense]MCC2875455.1 sugar ABC transporter ATP-binding protein [Lachnoclostridium pacaense]MCH1949553.1 sugar ABC transporter ATP-binding protein [Enterocloster sp. OA13]
MGETILEMRKVTKRFPGVIALKDVSIELRKGEILAVCGENGAGKSTLMKVLSGSYVAGEYEGEILIDGKPAEMTSVASAERYGIEMVYQEMNMMLDATIAENVFVGNLPGKNGFVNYRRLYADTRKILDDIGLDIEPDTKARSLNSGQMQMLSIMRALSRNPRIMVLDEPTSALTDQETELLMKLMDDLRKRGVSCLFISHRLDEVFRIADRVVVMRDGAFISCREIGSVCEKQLVEEMVGRTIENMYPKEKARIGEEILRVENLSVPHPTMKNKNIVENVGFHVRKGEILGIGGLVGAGRSEMLGAVFGQITKGVKKQVYIGGKKVEINCPGDAIRNGIGFVTEERKKSGFVWVFTIRENLSLASLKNISKGCFIDKKYEKQWVKKMFDRLRVKAPSIETVIVNLSGGNQQKVVLGKWLLEEPQILFIDEPTKGIDVGAKTEIYKIMNELTEQGVAIVMVSSDMPELISMSDRCIVLSNGRITGEFNNEEITQDRVMQAALAE